MCSNQVALDGNRGHQLESRSSVNTLDHIAEMQRGPSTRQPPDHSAQDTMRLAGAIQVLDAFEVG